VEVLVPLQMSDLGASGAAIGAAFLIAAIGDAVLNPVAGRLSDRRGRLLPIVVGLVGAIAMTVFLPLPGTAVLLAIGIFIAFASLAGIWAPAMALLSDASEAAGLDQALAFSIANISWGVGQLVGSGGGGALADATSDAIPYALLGAVCAATLAGVLSLGRGGFREAPAESS
jgi:MFS family permease